MLTPIAERLIHNLRHDAHTREHFSINFWTGKGTCSTVGCIAGTAIFMEMGQVFTEFNGAMRLDMYIAGRKFDASHTEPPNYVTEGARILGLDPRTARDLFLPGAWWEECFEEDHFDYMPTQARPSKSRLAEIQAARWRVTDENCEDFYNVTPDRAALALERIVKDEVLYCDWLYARENA